MSSPGKLDPVDGLRGAAILAVIAFHHRLECESLPVRTWVQDLTAPARLGGLGVNLFLVLSGFCLQYSLLRRARSGRSPSLWRYLADRWRRIAPPYYAAIALFLAVALLDAGLGRPTVRPEPLDLMQVVSHLTFLHGFGRDTIEGINSPFWSLSLEFQFYVTLPILAAAALRFGHRRVLFAVLAIALAYRAIIIFSLPGQARYLAYGVFLGRWPEFLLGMAVASWYDSRLETAESPGTRRLDVIAAFAFLTLGIILTSLGRFRGPALVADLVLGAGFAALLRMTLSSADRGGRLARVLARPALVAVGTISYSLYLTHSLALAWIDRAYPRLVGGRNTAFTDAMLMVVAYALVAALGIAFYRLVERRFIRSVDARATAGQRRPASYVPHAAADIRPATIVGP